MLDWISRRPLLPQTRRAARAYERAHERGIAIDARCHKYFSAIYAPINSRGAETRPLQRASAIAIARSAATRARTATKHGRARVLFTRICICTCARACAHPLNYFAAFISEPRCRVAALKGDIDKGFPSPSFVESVGSRFVRVCSRFSRKEKKKANPENENDTNRSLLFVLLIFCIYGKRKNNSEEFFFYPSFVLEFVPSIDPPENRGINIFRALDWRAGRRRVATRRSWYVARCRRTELHAPLFVTISVG